MTKNNEMLDIIEILYSLKEEIRLFILGEVFVRGSGGISFKEVVSSAGIGPTNAAYHLKVLSRVGLIEKRFRNEGGRREYSFYHITPLGEEAYILARGMFESVLGTVKNDLDSGLPDIKVTTMRHGPRCISIERIIG